MKIFSKVVSKLSCHEPL